MWPSIETGGGVQGGSDSVGELDVSSDEALVTTKPRVRTGGSLVVCLICCPGCAREEDDENCEGPALIAMFSGSSDARVSRVGGAG